MINKKFFNFKKVGSVYVLALIFVMALNLGLQEQNLKYYKTTSFELSKELKTEIQENKALKIENKVMESLNRECRIQNKNNMDLFREIKNSYDYIIFILITEKCPGPLWKKLKEYKRMKEKINLFLNE